MTVMQQPNTCTDTTKFMVFWELVILHNSFRLLGYSSLALSHAEQCGASFDDIALHIHAYSLWMNWTGG